jgi:RNA-directed DNA polymerase
MAEETACKKSFGFRLHCGLHDNAIYLKLVLGSYISTRRYVLKADIQGFFLSVSHNWLLESVIMDKRILREFLKAGYLKISFFMIPLRVSFKEVQFLHH